MSGENKNSLRLLPFIVQIALTMIVSMAVGGFLGFFVGKWLNFKAAVLLGLMLGAAGGMSSVLKQLSRYIKKPEGKAKSPLSEREKKLIEAERAFEEWKAEKGQTEVSDEDE